MGVRLDLLKFCQPSSGDEALDMAAQLAGSGGIDIVVIDSVAALIPKSEIEGDIGVPTVGMDCFNALRTHELVCIASIGRYTRASQGDTLVSDAERAALLLRQLRPSAGCGQHQPSWDQQCSGAPCSQTSPQPCSCSGPCQEEAS